MLIALLGPMGVGKSTAAKHLVEQHRFQLIKLAGPLKAMTVAFLMENGDDSELAHRRIEGDLKEVPCEAMGGRTPRYFMQRLGTEFGRGLICDTLWTESFRTRARAALDAGLHVVVDDLRFANEAALVRKMGGYLIGVRRSGHTVDVEHESERGGAEPDYSLWNDGTPEALGWRLDGFVHYLGRAAAA